MEHDWKTALFSIIVTATIVIAVGLFFFGDKLFTEQNEIEPSYLGGILSYSEESDIIDALNFSQTHDTALVEYGNKIIRIRITGVTGEVERNISNQIDYWKNTQGETLKWGANMTIPNQNIADTLTELRYYINIEGGTFANFKKKLNRGINIKVGEYHDGFVSTDRFINFNFDDLLQVPDLKYNATIDNETFEVAPEYTITKVDDENILIVFNVTPVTFISKQVVNLDPTISIEDVSSYSGAVFKGTKPKPKPYVHALTDDKSMVMYITSDYEDGVAHDHTRYGNNCTPTNSPEWNSDQTFGGTFNYTSSESDNDYLNCGSEPVLDNMPEISGCAWIRPASAGQNEEGHVMGKGFSATPIDGWNFGYAGHSVDNNYMQFEMDMGNNQAQRLRALSASGCAPFNQWNHVCFTWGGESASANVTFYCNGNLQGHFGSDELDGNNNRGNDAAQVFSSGLAGGTFTTIDFDGEIDQIMVWNRTISSSEVSNIYQNTSELFQNPRRFSITNITFTAGDNRVNVTYNATLFEGSTGIDLFIEEHIGGASQGNTTAQPLSDGNNNLNTLNITATTTNITLHFNFTTPTLPDILRDGVSITTWTEGAGPPADDEYPQFSNYWDSNSTNQSDFAYFNVTFTSTNGSAFVEINGTNYTASNDSATEFNVTINLTTAGTFEYYWGSWGNGTDANYNTSIRRNYTVNPVAVEGDVALDINFTDPTPANGSQLINQSTIFVNISTNSTLDHYTFLDFNNSVFAFWRFDDVNSSGDVTDYFGRFNGTSQNITYNSSGRWGDSAWFNSSSFINFGEQRRNQTP